MSKGYTSLSYWGSLLFGILLLWGVLSFSDLSWGGVTRGVASISFMEYGALLFLYGLIIWLSSRRWQFIVRLVSDVERFATGFFFYNIALSQTARLLPLGHVAGFGVKLASLKVDGNTSIGQGVCCGATEAVFNLFAIGCLALCGLILVVAPSPTFFVVAFIGVVVAVISLLFISRFNLFMGLVSSVLGLVTRLAARFPGVGIPLAEFQAKMGCVVLPPRQVAGLLGYTFSFYLLGLVRLLFLIWMMDIDISVTQFFIGYPVILAFSLFGLTPSGLGLVELGWTGLLVHYGIPADTAAAFALVRRVVDETSLLLLTGMGLATFKVGSVIAGKQDKANQNKVIHDKA